MTAVLATPIYTCTPEFVVRVCGTPAHVLDGLRLDRTTALVDSALGIEERLHRDGPPLADRLYDVVGSTVDTRVRRRLLALRRDLFTGRTPKDATLGPDLDATLGVAGTGSLAEDVRAWCDDARRRTRLLDDAAAVLPEERDGARRALCAAAQDPALRLGLALASPDLAADVRRWESRAGGPVPDPHLERNLAKYIARAAVKTSPYSTFTGSAAGRWSHGEDGSGPLARFPARLARRGVAELNAFTVQQIRRAVAQWPPVRDRLPITVNTSVVEDGDVLHFVGHRDGEAVLSLPQTPTLRRVLDEVRHGADRTHGGVVRALAGAGGQADADVAAFLDGLVQYGLLSCELDVPDDAPDPLGLLVDRLDDVPDARAIRLRSLLAGLRADLRGYPRRDDPVDRTAAARAVRERTGEVYGVLGWVASEETVPPDVFYEDTLLTGGPVECDAERWRPVLDSLDLLRRAAGPFDRFRPARVAAADFFARRYGPGARVGLVAFHRDVLAAFGGSDPDLMRCYDEPFPVPELGLPGLDALRDAQRRISDVVASTPVGPEGACRVRPERLEPAIGDASPIDSVAFHVQPLGDQVVLNEFASGHGRSRARLRRLDAVTGAGVFAGAPSEGAEHVEHVEIVGAGGSNLNLTRPGTARVIGYPGGLTSRPEDRRLRFDQMHVRYRPDGPTLHVDGEDGRVVPVHLGTMVEFLLPPAYRFLLQMFGQAPPRFEFVKHLATVAPAGERDGVRRLPRLCLGPVVVNRAAWTVRASAVPRPAPGAGACEQLVELSRWRRRHGIPARCFVRAFDDGDPHSARARRRGFASKARKPLHVDFANPFSLEAFERATRSPEQLLVLEEMVPDPTDGAGSTHVCELVVEIGGMRS